MKVTSLTGFPGGSVSKESTCQTEDLGSVPGWEDPLEEGMATHCSRLQNPHGQRSLEGYSPWGHKELYPTKQLSTQV